MFRWMQRRQRNGRSDNGDTSSINHRIQEQAHENVASRNVPTFVSHRNGGVDQSQVSQITFNIEDQAHEGVAGSTHHPHSTTTPKVKEGGISGERTRIAMDAVHEKQGRDYWLSKIQKDWSQLRYAPNIIRNDEDIVYAAVEQDVKALRYASPHVYTDVQRKYWMSKIQNDWRRLEYAPERIRKDREIAGAAIEQHIEAIGFVSPEIQEFIDTSHCVSEKWMHGIITDKKKLENAPEYIRKQKKVVLAAVEYKGEDLRFASPDLRNNKEVAIAAIKKDAEAIRYASPELQQDEDIICAHWITKVEKDWRILEDAPRDVREKKRVVLAAIGQDIEAYKFASPQLQEDYDILYEYWKTKVTRNWQILEDAPPNVLDHKGLVLAAIKQDTRAYAFASPQLQEDKEVLEFYYEHWRTKVTNDGLLLGAAPINVRDNKKLVLAAMKQNVQAHEFASPQLQEDEEVVDIYHGRWLERVKHGLSLEFAPERIRNHKRIVTVAIEENGEEFKYASPQLQEDTDLLDTLERAKHGLSLEFAPERIRNHKRIVMVSIQKNGDEFKYVSPQLQEDKDVLDIYYSYFKKHGLGLEFAPERIRNHKRFVMSAIRAEIDNIRWSKTGAGKEFELASPRLQRDKDVLHAFFQYWLSKVQSDWKELEHAPKFTRRADRNDLIMTAFQQIIRALEFVSINDKEVVIDAIQQNPWSFEFVPGCLKKNKDVVLAALKMDIAILKFVDEDLKRDRDVLVAAGMFDENHDDIVAATINASALQQTQSIKKIALSTRFSLHSSSHSDVTNFTRLFKGHPYIDEGDFIVYAPNAFNKNTCDPNWTDYNHPCRGTRDTCQFDDSLKTGHPTDECCWRYSFRYQLIEAKKTRGFMLQIIERLAWGSKDPQSLGNGQRIEREMAHDLGVKIFQVYRPITSLGFEFPFDMDDIQDIVVPAVKDWYDRECDDMSECILRLKR